MVQPPITKNDRMYDTARKKSSIASRRLIEGHKHFSESVMASVAVSKASNTSVHFNDKGTKVNASYYRETLLHRCLLSEIRQKFGDHVIFRQDGTPSHQVKSTMEFLQRMVPNFIKPSVCPSPTARTSTRFTTLYGGLCSRACIAFRFEIWTVRTCWENIVQQIINKSVDRWHDRLKAVVRVNAGHIEQLF